MTHFAYSELYKWEIEVILIFINQPKLVVSTYLSEDKINISANNVKIT